MILSRIRSSSSSVASLLPALNFESTYLAGMKPKWMHGDVIITWLTDAPAADLILLYSPMSSAGLFDLLLMKVSKASFIVLMNPSFRAKQHCATLSILSLKSSRSCTMSLSFSGVHTISPPKAFEQRQFQQCLHGFGWNVGCCLWPRVQLPLYNPSRTAVVWEVLLSPCWKAGRGGSVQSRDSHPAGFSDLQHTGYSYCMCV